MQASPTQTSVPIKPVLNRFGLLLMLISGFLFLLVLSVELIDGDFGILLFRLKALLAVICSVGIFRYVSIRSRGYLLPRLINLVWQMQVVLVFVVSIVEPNAYISNMSYVFRLRDHIDLSLLGLMLMQLGPVLTVWGLNFIKRNPSRASLTLRERVQGTGDRFAYFLLFLAVIRFLFIADGRGLLGPIGFFVRVLHAMFLIAPLFVPMLAYKYRKIKLAWVFVIIVTGVVGLLTGGRFTPLISAVLYSIGLILSQPPGLKRRALISTAILLFVPFVTFINVLGALRSEYGRIDYQDVNTSRLVSYVGAISDADIDKNDGETSLQRLINWPSLLIPSFSPEIVKYRGLDNLDNEFKYLFDLGFVTGTTRGERFADGVSTAPARRYGFRVTTVTSVDYSVLADGWARGGPVWLLIYSLLMTIILIGVESWVWNAKLFGKDAALIFIMPVMVSALFISRSDPLYHVLKHLWMDLLFLCVVYFFFVVFYKFGLRRDTI